VTFDGSTRTALPSSCYASGNAPRTFMAYISNAKSEDGFHIFGQGSYGTNTMWVVSPRTDSYGLMVWAHNHDINTRVVRTFPRNTWHHLAVTWDGTNYKFFYDGSEVASGSTSAFNTASGAWLGGSPFSQGSGRSSCAPHNCWFTGTVSDFRYFSTALTPTEVSSFAAMARTPA